MSREANPAPSEWEADVARLLPGSVDLHCHSGPSVMARLIDHIEALEEAGKAGMRAVLFKDHYYPTAPAVELIRSRHAAMGCEPLAGMVLNNAAGGFNLHALEPMLKMGTRLVWMPTVSAANHVRHDYRKIRLPTKSPMIPPVQLSILDARGRIIDEVKAVLDMIAEYDVALSGGHLHVSECFALFAEARSRGVKRLLLNHPSYTVDATAEDMKDLAATGVMLEHSICMFVECRFREFSPEDLRSYIDAAGVDMTFFGSDLGQVDNPTPVEGFRRIIRLLLAMGYSDADIRKMTSDNARRLVGLDSNEKHAVQPAPLSA